MKFLLQKTGEHPTIILLFILLCCILNSSQAQGIKNSAALNIGDPAPPIKVSEWIKGKRVKVFEKGQIYVVEFWATWCQPCIAAMPELSDLAKKYRDKISVVGVDILENKSVSKNRIYDFVDSMGKRMNYNVAIDDNQIMEASWYNATAEPGIPKTFLINDEGIISWIGNPKGLSEVLPKVVNHDWNIPEALTKRNLEKRLKEQDYEASYRLREYLTNGTNCDTYGNPDSALLAIKDIVTKDPNMRFTPIIVLNTFTALLKKDQEKAYEYGSMAIETSTYTDPAYGIIISSIEEFSRSSSPSENIYLLGANTYKKMISNYPWNATYTSYQKMAEWYWLGNNRTSALRSQKKALKEMKRQKRKTSN